MGNTLEGRLGVTSKNSVLMMSKLPRSGEWIWLVLAEQHTTPGFSLGLNDGVERPVVLFSALSFFLSALSFFQRPVIFREPFGFFGFSSALFWAWSCRKRPIKAKGGVIFVHHVVIRVGRRRHLGFTMNINLRKLVRPVVFQDQREHWTPYRIFASDSQMSLSGTQAICAMENHCSFFAAHLCCHLLDFLARWPPR